MKNAISYYYNLNPNELHQNNKIYKFEIKNIEYIMYPYHRKPEEIEEIYSLYLSLINSGYYCHHIIPNNNKELITIINNTPYVLLKILISNRSIGINDIMTINNIFVDDKHFSKIKRNDWYRLWIDKIDYIEYQINQFGKKYPLLRESSDYYIGIVETCISLLVNLKPNISIKTICHNRIIKETTTYQLYNPIEFIIDNRVRDASEYFKMYILDDDKILDKIKKYIYINQLNEDETILFFIRILYPSQYFDVCEEIINNKMEEKEILNIINKVDAYQKNIQQIYYYIKSITKLPDIEWLKKK